MENAMLFPDPFRNESSKKKYRERVSKVKQNFSFPAVHKLVVTRTPDIGISNTFFVKSLPIRYSVAQTTTQTD